MIHNICANFGTFADETDQIITDNTNRAIMELCSLYYNSNFVAKKISEKNTRIEGYTRYHISDLTAAVDVVRSRYGYYCNISFSYEPCNMSLTIDVEERKM